MEKLMTKVYIPLDYKGIGKAVGSEKPHSKIDTYVFGPLAGTTVDVDVLKQTYATAVRGTPGFGKNGGVAGKADVTAANIRIGWLIKHGVFVKIPE
jgi:hypothetical protein